MTRTSGTRIAAGTRQRDQYALLYSALGDPVRLQLLERLGAGGPASIAALTAGTRITRQAVSKHLRTLEAVGLVCSSHRGRECLWIPLPERLRDAQAHMTRISAHWDRALERLRLQVEAR